MEQEPKKNGEGTDFELERKAMSKSEMLQFTGVLSDKLVPRYVFIMRTKRDPNAPDVTAIRHRAVKMIERAAEGTSMPQSVKDDLIEKLVQRGIKATSSAGGGKVWHEIHSMVVLQNMDTGKMSVIVNDCNSKTGTFTADPAVVMHKEDEGGDEDAIVDSARLSGKAMFYLDGWKGEREEYKEIERATGTLAEMLEAIDAAGYGAQFRLMFTTSSATPAAVVEVAAKKPTADTKAQRAALVKRFGEKNVKALEKKIKAAKQV